MPDPRNRLQWNATCKVHPAIADLQAIEEVIQYYDSFTCLASITYTRGPVIVPSGKIWVITHALAYSPNAGTAIVIEIQENSTIKARLGYKLTATGYTMVEFLGKAYVDEGQYLRFIFYGYDAPDVLSSNCVGYQISKY